MQQEGQKFWLYAGRRLGRSGQAVDAWVQNEDGTGDLVLYPASRGASHVLGASYRVRMDRQDPRCTMDGTPEFHRGQVASMELRLE